MKGEQYFNLYCRVDDRLADISLPRDVHEIHLAALFAGFTSRISRRPGKRLHETITSAELIPPPKHKVKYND